MKKDLWHPASINTKKNRYSFLTWAIAITTFFTASAAQAAVYYYNRAWMSGSYPGYVAANCYVQLPDQRPMAVPRTLVVSEDTPNNTVIFNFGEMFGAYFTTNCVSTGSVNTTAGTTNGTYTYWDMNILITAAGGVEGIQLNDPGLRLRLYITPAALDTYALPVVAAGAYSSSTRMFVNQTYKLTGIGSGNTTQVQYLLNPHGGGTSWALGGWSSFAISGEIVKVGNLTYPAALSTVSSSAFSVRTPPAVINGMLDGTGIRVVRPSCVLNTTDYTIPMKSWFSWPSSLPAYGPKEPVNLTIKCSGKMNHVRFRFEDAGSSPSSTKNVTLYDSLGGTKITGVEIEMLYNNSKVNVDSVTKIDAGSFGQAKSSYWATPIYDSFGTAAFQARYVQTAAIKKSGSNYTGPIVGKVNMYVTYD